MTIDINSLKENIETLFFNIQRNKDSNLIINGQQKHILIINNFLRKIREENPPVNFSEKYLKKVQASYNQVASVLTNVQQHQQNNVGFFNQKKPKTRQDTNNTFYKPDSTCTIL